MFTDLVRVETRLYNAVTDRVRAAAGISAGHFEFLRYVRDHADARVADLATAFAIGTGATSKIVDRLEKESWLTRHPNPTNRRSSLLTLTASGESAVRQAEPAWTAAIEEHLHGFASHDEIAVVARVLQTLRSNLESRRVGVPAG
jgi:MarR family multiple antibiotic resistance transcriptional regulator